MVPFNLILNIVEWLSAGVAGDASSATCSWRDRLADLGTGARASSMLGGATFAWGWMISTSSPLQAFIFMMLSIVYLSRRRQPLTLLLYPIFLPQPQLSVSIHHET